jgi:hypothetical protein
VSIAIIASPTAQMSTTPGKHRGGARERLAAARAAEAEAAKKAQAEAEAKKLAQRLAAEQNAATSLGEKRRAKKLLGLKVTLLTISSMSACLVY